MKVESSLRAVIQHLLSRDLVKSMKSERNAHHLFTSWFLKEVADFL